MSAFLLTFFTVYGLMHAYVFLKAKAALGFGLRAGLPLAVFMLVMVCAPVIVRLTEKAGYESFARVMSHIGYVWLGVIFLFISFAAVIDVYHVGIGSVKLVARKPLSGLHPTPQFSFYAPLILSLAVSAYGYFEALDIRAERVTIPTAKLPASVERLKIIQISDVHLGLIVRERRLGKILAIVAREEPDILVSTGDLVDGQIDNLNGLSEMLAGIRPPHGKYAITGNHEFYAGLKQSLSFTERAGFTLLRNRGIPVNGLINIAGVDDPTAIYYGSTPLPAEQEILSSLSRERFTLLLKHRPLIDRGAVGLFDLQLSGHTHKGQIFPFSIATWLYYPVHAGCLNPVDGCYLYVSRGSGTWGPPLRFLSPPEVTVIELVRHTGK